MTFRYAVNIFIIIIINIAAAREVSTQMSAVVEVIRGGGGGGRGGGRRCLLLDKSRERGVPAVFDGIISSAWQLPRDLCPFVT